MAKKTSPKKPAKLQWKKRPSRRVTTVSVIHRWVSLCGNYAIERHKYSQVVTYPDAWFALHIDLTGRTQSGEVVPCWRNFGNPKIHYRRRSRAAAEKACQEHSAKGTKHVKRR